jgi:hypothetical protein
LFEALPRRRSRRLLKGATGKAKPFRKESGKAAVRKNLFKNKKVLVCCTENTETRRAPGEDGTSLLDVGVI